MEDVDGENIYSGIIQVVKFIYERICFQNVSWNQVFGRLTWTRISDLIISSFLSKVCFLESSHVSCIFFRFFLYVQRHSPPF